MLSFSFFVLYLYSRILTFYQPKHMNEKETFRYKHYLRVINRLNKSKVIPLFDFLTYKGVKNHYNLKCMICDFEFIDSFDCGFTPKCPKCFPNRLTKNYGHPEKVDIKCEYCGIIFNIIWKNRHHRFCSVPCKCEFIKKNKREMVNCLKCDKSFERYKHILHPRTGKPTQYCSNECNRSSIEVNEKKRKWGLSEKNHWNNSECQKKVKETKIEKYGNENYNNIEKQKITMMDKYGVSCGFYLPSAMSNGKRISNFQKREYEKILNQYPDALLEKYLPDVQKSVDIFIPSENKVIECHGDYWHCNPTRCGSDYYNKVVHLTAQQIWDKDKQKREILEKAGYQVEIIWENTGKKFKHSVL